jgi:hypothetical protein
VIICYRVKNLLIQLSGAEKIDMLNKKQALELIANSLGDGMGIIHEKTVELPYGWVIYSQSKKFLKTNNDVYAEYGHGPTLVEKGTGRLIELDGYQSLEENLKCYELGYREHDNWEIVITKVYNHKKATRAITDLELTYVIPEEAHGVIWKIPIRYTDEQVSESIKSLPCVFYIGRVYGYLIWPWLGLMKEQGCFDYFLKGHRNT